MDNRNYSTSPETEKTLLDQERSPARSKRQGTGRRLLSLVLSAALFGGVSAGTFYGVGRLLPEEETAASVEGMGYAIPISDVAELVAQLMTQNTELNQTSSSTVQQPTWQMPGWRGMRPAI